LGYTAKYKHRNADHPGGGVAILVRNDINFLDLDPQLFPMGNLEVIGVNVILENNRKLSVLTMYNPNKTISSAEFVHYFSKLSL
jgi:hypothetical protein